MGLVGLLISVLLIILGAGYWLFRPAPGPVTMTNEAVPAIEMNAAGLSQAEALIESATDAKAVIEEKTKEAVEAAQPAPAPTPPAPVAAPVKEDAPKETGGSVKIENRLMSSGFAVPKSKRSIDTIVLHSSYDALGNEPYSVSGLIKEYEEYGVSAHYLIDRKGVIYRLVADENISYHAGVSQMKDGRTGVNDFSIGIELMNQKDTQYTDAQYEAVNDLVKYLKGKHQITSVVGHDDIAPDRKSDPWNFDWKKLK